MSAAPASTLDFAQSLIHTRQHISPKKLLPPGPSAEELQIILEAAAAAPDHRQLLPWRFVWVPAAQRERLAQVFAQALVLRDPSATPEQIQDARGKAFRAPVLLLAIARLVGSEPASQSGATLEAHANSPHEPPVNNAERLLSLGCAVQNMLLTAHAAGYGTGLTSGQALDAAPLQALFELQEHEQAVCWINIGTVTTSRAPRVRPKPGDYLRVLD